MNTVQHDSTLTARARRYLTDAGRAFERAPVEVTLSVILAIAFSWSVEAEADSMRDWAELATVAVIAIAVAFTATLLHLLGSLSTRGRWALTLGGVLTAAACGMFALDFRLEADAWRALALIVASVLLILGAPALAGRDGALERYRRVSGRLVIRVLAVLIYAVALFAGLALALVAIDTLFELDLDEKIYAHVFGWNFLVLVPWTIIGGVNDYVRPSGDANPVGSAVHRLASFLVTPLVIIYFVILYAYVVRIGITGEMPKNLVSPLVTVAGVLTGVALTLFDRSDGRPVLRSLRALIALFIPLCALGIWAILIRLGQYGWTEFRGLRLVVLAALGAMAITGTIAVLRRRQPQLQALPLVLSLVLVLAVIGPWSVPELSRRSQQARLAAAMADAGLARDATVVQDSIVSDSVYIRMRETTRYLNSSHGAGSLPPLFAQHASDDGRRFDLVAAAGLQPERPGIAEVRAVMARLEDGAVLENRAGSTLHYVRVTDLQRTVPADSTVGAESFIVRIPIAGVSYTADLAATIDALLAAPQPYDQQLNARASRVALRDDAGNERGELYITVLNKLSNVPTISQFEGVARLDRN